MELKKNPSKDIHRRYPLHFCAGLCISCGLIIGAFELQFKKEPDVVPYSDDWGNAMALIDLNIQVDRPPAAVKKKATPVQVVTTIVPATIEIAADPTAEPEVIVQTDPFEPTIETEAAHVAPVIPDVPLNYADEMPQPVDGFEKFYKQIAREVRYTRAAAQAEVEGKVYVEFVIDREGNPTFVKVVRGIGYGCDEQAAKALTKTKWKPGKQHGAPVRVRMIMPITFSLTK